MKKCFLVILALLVVLGLGVPTLVADDEHHGDERHGDGNHGNGHRHGNKHHDRDNDRDNERDHGNGQGWEQRDAYEYRTYSDREERPRGWSRGRKTGWRNCGLPPGQAKKYGCRSYVYQGRPHYYYEDEGGRILIRRPIIRLRGGIDIIP